MKIYLRKYGCRYLRNEELISKDKKRAFMLSDQATFRPWPEGTTFIEECRKKYTIQDSANVGYIKKKSQTIGRITTDSIRKCCTIENNMSVHRLPLLSPEEQAEMKKLQFYDPAKW